MYSLSYVSDGVIATSAFSNSKKLLSSFKNSNDEKIHLSMFFKISSVNSTINTININDLNINHNPEDMNNFNINFNNKFGCVNFIKKKYNDNIANYYGFSLKYNNGSYDVIVYSEDILLIEKLKKISKKLWSENKNQRIIISDNKIKEDINYEDGIINS